MSDYPRLQVLAPHHREMLQASAISEEVIAARGYWTAERASELERLGFGRAQCNAPTLVVPIYGVNGEIVTYQHRPDMPRMREGKPLKYETPAKSTMALDVPKPVLAQLRDPSIPLVITEGAKKADAAVSAGLCCIALLGVWNWRGTNEEGGKTALPDWDSIALKGVGGVSRRVYIAFDSDVMEKKGVHTALVRLTGFLESRGAEVRLIYLPHGENGAKIGLDDYLAAGHSVDELLSHATDKLRRLTDDEDGDGSYRVTNGGMVYMRPTANGLVPFQLTNFVARISGSIAEDDGSGDTRRMLELEVILDGRRRTVTIPADRFAAMNWPIPELGPRAMVYPGQNTRDHARAAIQQLSDMPVDRTIFTHTGWRMAEAADGTSIPVYLHADGAIGTIGTISQVEVRLPEPLRGFIFPDPVTGEELQKAVLASLDLEQVAKREVMIALLGAVYRAPLAQSDFTVHLAGPTGVGKSQLAALAQQHWGAGLDSLHLPGTWSSTGNSLEGLAFRAKDALLVVDDFAPSGTSYDVQRYHKEAERLLRAQGNQAGRLRMRQDGSLRTAQAPRGLILSTGEDIPRGQSIRGRSLILEVDQDTVDWEALTRAQRLASEGVLAQAMAGYVQWLAGYRDEVNHLVREEVARFRRTHLEDGSHKRLSSVLGDLSAGWLTFLTFAVDVGAINQQLHDAIWRRVETNLPRIGGRQQAHQSANEPAHRFIELVAAALASGRAHLTDANGLAPRPALAYGWVYRDAGSQSDYAMESRGPRIGWIDGENLYLIPEAAFGAAQAMGTATGEALTVQSKTLSKRLSEQGFLLSEDTGRGRLTVRRSFDGSRFDVWHLPITTLEAGCDEESSQSSQSAQVTTTPQQVA